MADTVADLAGPIVTLIGGAAPVVAGMINKPKMPKLEAPTAKATPNMPAPDDDAARAAALQSIARRSSQQGRKSTQLYERETLG